MSAIRKSSRITKKSCINVKLNVSDGIEFVDADGVVESMDVEEEWTAEIIDGENEDDEELIENPDGTMSIKMASKSNGAKRDATRRDCAKCGLSFSSDEVNFNKIYRNTYLTSIELFTCSQTLTRHENICRHMPFNQIAYKDEDDYANVDVYHKKYNKICFCCNEDLATAHVSHHCPAGSLCTTFQPLSFSVRPCKVQFLPEIIQVAQQFGTTSVLVAFGCPGISVRILQCNVFVSKCFGRAYRTTQIVGQAVFLPTMRQRFYAQISFGSAFAIHGLRCIETQTRDSVPRLPEAVHADG